MLAGAALSLALAGCTTRPIEAHDGGGVPGDDGGPGRGPSDGPATQPADGPATQPADGPATQPGDPTLMLVAFSLENEYCGLKSGGRVRCWASQPYFTDYLAPIAAAAPPGLVQIAASDTVSSDLLLCGLDAQGDGTCWGARTSMDMGAGLASIAVDRYGPCALHQDGRVTCTGGIQGLPAGHHYVQIALSADFIAGLDDTGTPIDSSGAPDSPPGVYRRVGTVSGTAAALRDDGAIVKMTWPQPMIMPGAFVDLSFNLRRLCGLDGAGEITCFPLDDLAPAAASPPAGPFTQIANGYTTMCGLRPNGTTTCWGDVAVPVPDGW